MKVTEAMAAIEDELRDISPNMTTAKAMLLARRIELLVDAKLDERDEQGLSTLNDAQIQELRDNGFTQDGKGVAIDGEGKPL